MLIRQASGLLKRAVAGPKNGGVGQLKWGEEW